MSDDLFAFTTTPLEGVLVIRPKIFRDPRGLFIKPWRADCFNKQGLELPFQEIFYSVSRKRVVRGMHFQAPPHDQAKLVFVPAGCVRDIVLDIRRGSATYGRHICVELSEENRRLVYIPCGCAHGFGVFSSQAVVVYAVTGVYRPESEGGIRWDSFGADWGIKKPLVSERDSALPSFSGWTTPFSPAGEEK
ncbi:dTDP-4-dehydrorhamnose 3,5-epimerase [candidate division FCPU426 bacterium]|nr:dTDP-4-dehydrorhamnose 3,5-epimerase [candidate division FCPU426 bacterium]